MPSRKLPPRVLEGEEPELVERRDDDAEPLTDTELGLTARPVEDDAVIRLDAHTAPATPRGLKAGVRELARRFTVQSINELARLLKDRDPKIRYAAAMALLSRGHGQPAPEGKLPGDDGEGSEKAADLVARFAALDALRSSPEYHRQVALIAQSSGIVKDPDAPPEVVAPPEEDLVQQLLEEPEPEEAIEVEVVREHCYCGCKFEDHPSGAGCISCPTCNLYSPMSESNRQ